MEIFRTLTAGTHFKTRKLSTVAQPQASTSQTPLEVDIKQLRATKQERAKASTAPRKAGTNVRKRKHSSDEDAEREVFLDSDTLRKLLRIRCTGSEVPAIWPTFSSFSNITDAVLENLALMGVLQPTPIQMQASSIIHRKIDLLACAPTGSGKTLAFLLPLLLLSLSNQPAIIGNGPRALVVEPTRELARQVYTEAGKIKGGTGWRVSLLGESGDSEDLRHSVSEASCDLLVTTPLKLLYAIKRRQVDLAGVQHLILDEADSLFDLDLLSQTDEIIDACPLPSLRKAMFSATIPSGVEELAMSVMSSDMIRIIIGGSDMATSTITQELTYTGNEDGKLLGLKNLIRSGCFTPPALIFVQSIDRAKDLSKELQAFNIKSDVMHSERTKDARDRVVQKFAEAKLWTLVCTDVMSRGIDFRGVELVVNYDFPQSVQSYIHRIGRTGRAGRSGKAITFFTKEDTTYLKSIANVMRNSGCEVPKWMTTLSAPTQKEKKKLRQRPVVRKDVRKSTGSVANDGGSKHSKRSTARKQERQDSLDNASDAISEEDSNW